MVFDSDRSMHNYANSSVKKYQFSLFEYLWLDFSEELGESLEIEPFEKRFISKHIQNNHSVFAGVDVSIRSKIARKHLLFVKFWSSGEMIN